MADGNLAVDVSKNDAYYIGDFKTLSTSLHSIQRQDIGLEGDVLNGFDDGADLGGGLLYAILRK